MTRPQKDVARVLPSRLPIRLLLSLTLSIFVAESLVMIVLSLLPPLPVWLATLFDTISMLILISPTLYFVVFRPLLMLIDERQQAEEALKHSFDELETRVQERTADLHNVNENLKREIIARRQAEDILRRSAEEYRQLMEEAAHGIVLFDAHGNFVAANAKACEMLEYEKVDLLRLNLRDLVLATDLMDVPPQWDIANAGHTVTAERRIRCKSGRIKFVETTSQRLADGRYQAFVRDITTRKLSEDRFRKAVQEVVHEQLFLKLRAFRHGSSGAMNLNRLGLMAENFEAAMSQKDVHDNAGSGRVGGDSTRGAQSTVLERFTLAADEYSTVVHPELVHIASLLHAAVFENSGAKIPSNFRGKADSIMELSAAVRDSTKYLLEGVEKWKTNGESTEEASLRDRLLQSSRQLLAVIDEVRLMSEAAFLCEVPRVVEASILKYQSSAPGIAIRSEDRSNGRNAICNTSELSVVLSIIMENALDALEGFSGPNEDSGRSITVRTRLHDSKIEIRVTDNGPGVPQEIRESIFQSGVSTKGNNRGFGLHYAKTCISKYGGKVYLDASVQRGASFVIELILV